jgi:hypothetical protein
MESDRDLLAQLARAVKDHMLAAESLAIASAHLHKANRFRDNAGYVSAAQEFTLAQQGMAEPRRQIERILATINPPRSSPEDVYRRAFINNRPPQ